jgi:hypothetical protein
LNQRATKETLVAVRIVVGQAVVAVMAVLVTLAIALHIDQYGGRRHGVGRRRHSWPEAASVAAVNVYVAVPSA